MNEKTEILIRELAEKFGTTGQHLWEVMVKQGPISGMINLLVLIVFIFISFAGYRFLKKKFVKNPNDPYRNDDEVVVIFWGIWAVCTFIIVVISATCLSSVITSIINPEYWALKQLLPK